MENLNIEKTAERLYNAYCAINLFSSETVTNGKQWYRIANDTAKLIAEDTNMPLYLVVGIIAALSPATSWERNIIDTIELIENGNDATVTTYGANKKKALLILSGYDPLDILGGNKVRSFYDNILHVDNSDCVTIDRHAIRAALAGTQHLSSESTAESLVKFAYTNKRYNILVAAYKLAAKKAGLLPLQFQAILWLAIRDDLAF